LHGVTSHPYQQTRAVTRGPDVVAYLGTPGRAAALAHASGVTGHSGPYPLVDAILRVRGLTAGAEAEGRTQAPAAVDQPKLTAGSWVRPGSVVIERAFAEALGLGPGGRVTLNGRAFTVAGIAVTAAIAPYPNICYSGCDITGYLGDNGIGAKNIGLIWMTEPDAVKLASAATPLNTYILNLKLSDPAQAPAFASRYSTNSPAGPSFNTWEDLASWYGLQVQDEQAVLVPGAVLLGLLAIASVAVLVGGRLAEHTRRVGLLKAVGGTPGLIAATFLAENLILAMIAAAAGLAAGWLAAPLLTSPGAALLGVPGAPSLTPLIAAVVVAAALAVALTSTLVPAIRAARTSTVRALADAARPPKRRGALISLSSRLPVPVLLGLRLAARRPRRALLSAASIAVTVAGLVAVLAFHATVNEELPGRSGRLANPVVARDEQMLLVITVVLALLAALNAIFTAWATVLDARNASALVRALGTTPGQVSGGLVAAQVLSALPGAVAGVPLGIVLFKAVAGNTTALPAAPWLAATVLGTLLVVAGVTTVAARIDARQPPSEVLQAETA
jgi:putative ABC transport system permease protein